jgi:hypothetical protein
MQELEAERRQWLFRVEATRSRVQAVRHMRSQSRRDEHSPPPPPPAALALDTPKTAPTIEERGAASKYSSRSSRLPPLAPRARARLTKPALTKPAVVKIHHGQLSHVVPMTPSRGWRYFAMAD